MTRLNTCTGTHAHTHVLSALSTSPKSHSTTGWTRVAFPSRGTQQRGCYLHVSAVAVQWNLTADEHQPYCVKAHRIYVAGTLSTHCTYCLKLRALGLSDVHGSCPQIPTNTREMYLQIHLVIKYCEILGKKLVSVSFKSNLKIFHNI